MKNSKKLTIICATLVILSLSIFVACNKKDDTKMNESQTEKTDVSNETNEEPAENEATNIPPVQTESETVISDDQANDSEDEKVTFSDHHVTGEYTVKKDGKYVFQCIPSDNAAYWDVYVLDEPFEDALRFLSSAYEPKFKATSDTTEFNLKKGQYVYCVCSKNSFTDDGNDSNFSCPLTIELDD